MYSSAELLKSIVAKAENRAALCRYMATAPDIDKTKVINLIAEAKDLESLAAAAERGDSSAIESLCNKMNIKRVFLKYKRLVELEAEADNTPDPFSY